MAETPTVLFKNATFFTMDPARPVAQVVAIRGQHIKAVGSLEDMSSWTDLGGARIIDLGGRIVTPGFNDCHMHLLPYGLDLSKADLSPAAGVTDVPSLVSALCEWADANPRSEWVLGSRYDQNVFPGAAHPTRTDLDRAFPDRPVYVVQTSKHGASCNSAALKLAGITRDTADSDGGEIVRDAAGEPTGVLLEAAMDLVSFYVPRLDLQTLVGAIRRANSELVKAGITSASDLNLGWLDMGREIDAYGNAAYDMVALDVPPIRTTLFPHAPAMGAPRDLPNCVDFYGLADPGRDRFTFEPVANPYHAVRRGPMKLFADGALTVRTAALREPYVDGSGSGMLLHDPEQLRAYIVEADRQGWQVAVHAIGDRAVELVLDCYAACDNLYRRHRIEHAMLLDDALIQRFVDQQVIPVIQPEFLSRLGDAYVLGLGHERASRLNPVASLQRAGLGVPFSSDCPIVPGAPLDGIRAASRRITRNGMLLGPEERVSPMDGLRNYTYWAAYSTFDELNVGRIMPGMRADFAVLECGLPVSDAGITEEHLDSLKVAATIIGGETVYGDT